MWIDERKYSLLGRWRHSLQFVVCKMVPGRVLCSFERIDVERLYQKMLLNLESMSR